MTIQECYQKLGGEFAQVEKRLPSVSLVRKFIIKFLDDDSYSKLCLAVQNGQREEAFRAAHTLKGVCGNLSLDKLYHSASELTELLRPEADAISLEAAALFETVKLDYDLTALTIRTYLDAAE